MAVGWCGACGMVVQDLLKDFCNMVVQCSTMLQFVEAKFYTSGSFTSLLIRLQNCCQQCKEHSMHTWAYFVSVDQVQTLHHATKLMPPIKA